MLVAILDYRVYQVVKGIKSLYGGNSTYYNLR